MDVNGYCTLNPTWMASFASLFRITAQKKLIPKGVSDQSLVDMDVSENSGRERDLSSPFKVGREITIL